MLHPRSVVSLVLTVASAGLVAGCGDNPLPVGPSNGVVSVAIEGPASLAPGQSAQYTVIERLADGTTRALPSAAWASSDSSLLQVTSSGVATAGSQIGEVSLTVRTTQSASKDVVVLPAHAAGLAGSYTLTLEAGSSCSVPLAAELQRRSYDATVSQKGLGLDVVLTERRFSAYTDYPGRFSGTVTATGATFYLDGGWTTLASVTEALPDGSIMEIWGAADTTASSGVFSGPFSGRFSHYRDFSGPYLGDCNASRFTLSRR